jgi:hypothetical protein
MLVRISGRHIFDSTTPWIPAALQSLIRCTYLAFAFSLSSLAFLTAGLACILWYHAQLVGYLDSHS